MNNGFKMFGLLIVLVGCSITVSLHAYLVGHGINSSLFANFWFPILTMAALVYYAVVSFDNKFPLLLIFLFALTLHLVQPIAQPTDFLWNTDGMFILQLVEHTKVTGFWTFGYGTGEALWYSFYPLLYIFLSVLSLVSFISSTVVIKYATSIVNPLVLLTLYTMLNRLFQLDVKTKNLVVFMFSLNPIFHAMGGYADAESYAMIFYPLILAQALKQSTSYQVCKRAATIVAILFLVIASISHHFTSYNIAFSLLFPAIFTYLVFRTTALNVRISIMALILPLIWLSYVAYMILLTHLMGGLNILNALTSIHTVVGYVRYGSAFTNYPSEFAIQLNWIRNLALALFVLLGLITYKKSKRKADRHWVALLFCYSAVTFLSLAVVNWEQVKVFSDIRERIVNFAFFPLAVFSSLGMLRISGEMTPSFPHNPLVKRKIKNRSRRKALIGLILAVVIVLVFVPSTIFNAFPRFSYDPTYFPFLSEEFPVAPYEHFALGRWTYLYVESSYSTVFTGSLSAQRYVIGYGFFQGTWSDEVFNATLRGKLFYPDDKIFFVVNEYNMELPDRFGRKLDTPLLLVLDHRFDRIYDNGVVHLHIST